MGVLLLPAIAVALFEGLERPELSRWEGPPGVALPCCKRCVMLRFIAGATVSVLGWEGGCWRCMPGWQVGGHCAASSYAGLQARI